MRDEFPWKVKEALAKRVAHKCSNPSCWAATSGPQTKPDKSISIGVAAHITAAAPGGPRFNASLTPAERCSAENGVWLCHNCAKLVDSDALRFSTKQLRAWKRNAEAAALESLGKADSRTHSGIALEPAAMEFAGASACMGEVSIELVEKYVFSLRNRFRTPIYDVWVRFHLHDIRPEKVILTAVPRSGAPTLPDGQNRADALALDFEDSAGELSLLLAICRVDQDQVYEFAVSVDSRSEPRQRSCVQASLLKWSQRATPTRSGRDGAGILHLFPVTCPETGTIRGIRLFAAK